MLEKLSLLTFLCYGLGTIPAYRYLWRGRPFAHIPFYLLSGGAWAGHGILLYRWIETDGGQNLSVRYMITLFFWLMVGYVLSMAARLKSISLGLYPLSALSILVASLHTAPHILQTGSHADLLIHILLATLATSVLGLAALQALLMVIQSHRLHRSNPFWQVLPPMDAMEVQLFRILTVGWILLTGTLISGLFFLDLHYATPQIAISLLTWGVLVALLWGRWVLRWHGMRIVKIALGAILCLWIAYMVSQLRMY